MVTVDADTLLHPDALRYLVSRLISEPEGQHVCACAGALVVEDPTRNLLTRMQSWDYRLGINGIKRMQAAYQSTLVAQGAFSAYRTDDVRAVGGWPDAIGEDIVLTWSMMASRGVVEYEPCALGATAAPDRVRQLMRQRSRWAQGMLEGLQRNPPAKQPRVLARFVCGIDYLVPLPRHRLRLLLGPGRRPLHRRLSTAVLVVVDADAADHPRHLRAAAPLAGAARLPSPRVPSPPRRLGFPAATCSAIGRWSRRLPCAATSNTRPGRHDAGNNATAAA